MAQRIMNTKKTCPGFVKEKKQIERVITFPDQNCRVFAEFEPKKLSLNLFNFFVILPGHDMFTITSKANTFKPGFKTPSASPHFGRKIALKTSQPFVEKKID